MYYNTKTSGCRISFILHFSQKSDCYIVPEKLLVCQILAPELETEISRKFRTKVFEGYTSLWRKTIAYFTIYYDSIREKLKEQLIRYCAVTRKVDG